MAALPLQSWSYTNRPGVKHVGPMAQDFRARGLYPHLPTTDLQMVCSMIVMTMLSAATDFLDLPPDQPLLETEMSENFVQQLKIILLGGSVLNDARTN